MSAFFDIVLSTDELDAQGLTFINYAIESAKLPLTFDGDTTYKTVVKKFKGEPIISKSGHSFMKDVMRENNAVYGGEMSAHHYFRDFFFFLLSNHDIKILCCMR